MGTSSSGAGGELVLIGAGAGGGKVIVGAGDEVSTWLLLLGRELYGGYGDWYGGVESDGWALGMELYKETESFRGGDAVGACLAMLCGGAGAV
jgi:hypothetical protein